MSHYEVAEVQGEDHHAAVEAAKRRLQVAGYKPDEKRISWSRIYREGEPPAFKAKVFAQHR